MYGNHNLLWTLERKAGEYSLSALLKRRSAAETAFLPDAPLVAGDQTPFLVVLTVRFEVRTRP